uniref:Uncharacterized protein n=1 Tax=Rhizophora mucronata TaxID=61149 RepID=A0A2P2NQT2_RHIMU
MLRLKYDTKPTVSVNLV